MYDIKYKKKITCMFYLWHFVTLMDFKFNYATVSKLILDTILINGRRISNLHIKDIRFSSLLHYMRPYVCICLVNMRIDPLKKKKPILVNTKPTEEK